MRHRIAVLGFALAVVAAVAAVSSGLGSRADLWSFRTGFQILRWAAWGGLAAAVLSLLGVGLAFGARPAELRSRALLLGATGLVIGLVPVWVPWPWKQRADGVPPIHDITTDTEDPPGFETILPLRAKRNAPETVDMVIRPLEGHTFVVLEDNAERPGAGLHIRGLPV